MMMMASNHLILSVTANSTGVSKLVRQHYEDPQVTGANRYKYFRRLDFIILQRVKVFNRSV